MYDFTCKSCGHKNEAQLLVGDIKGWQDVTPPEIVKKLKARYNGILGKIQYVQDPEPDADCTCCMICTTRPPAERGSESPCRRCNCLLHAPAMRKTFEFRTLYLSTGYYASPTSKVTPEPDHEQLEKNDLAVYQEKILPVLKTVNENFEIIGHLAPPNALDLAMTDLWCPRAVFTFVTIEVNGDDEYRAKLKQLGLSKIGPEGEGCITTVGEGNMTKWPFKSAAGNL